MKRPIHIAQFWRDEAGSLLVFFAVCTITILGIVALSFDLGRRAATQTDMQSFADNVVLAAAGELDGSSQAIINATAAARGLINAQNERLKAGTAGSAVLIDTDAMQLVFYEDLPANDAVVDPNTTDALLSIETREANKYLLPATGQTTDPTLARFVGVRLATVDVNWLFAGVFGSDNLPNEGVGAVAVAGHAEFLCDAVPVLFCLPQDTVTGQPAELRRGQGLSLRSSRQNYNWREGDFGFVNVAADPAGTCAGLTDETGRQACLLNLREDRAACFQMDHMSVRSGQQSNVETSTFDMRFDIFSDTLISLASDPRFAPGPHSISGRVPRNTGEFCAPTGTDTDNPTMAFPNDTCILDGSCDRFGDGVWDRDLYVETNYSWPDSDQPDVQNGSFFDFPETTMTRYRFYRREIERAARGGVMSHRGGVYADAVYESDNDGDGEDPATEYTTWDDYWPDTPTQFETGLNPIIPDTHGRLDNGLPKCNLEGPGINSEDRRVFVIGGIDCSDVNDPVLSEDTGVPLVKFYRVFMMSPVSRVASDPVRFDLNLEVIREEEPSSFGEERPVVQLYR